MLSVFLLTLEKGSVNFIASQNTKNLLLPFLEMSQKAAQKHWVENKKTKIQTERTIQIYFESDYRFKKQGLLLHKINWMNKSK